MIKAIIFDLGNVVVHVDKTEQYRKFSANCNKTAPYIKGYFEKSRVRKSFERGELTPIQFYTAIGKELNLRMSFNNFNRVWCGIFTLNKDVEKLIKKLKKSFRLILLSNTDILHYRYIKNKYKIINTFDDYVLSYQAGHRKPNPLIFLTALKRAKTLPFNCIYVDDIPEFTFIARLMGIKAFKYVNFGRLIKELGGFKII